MLLELDSQRVELGLSEREVSRLAWSGALTATKRGSVWWIAADAVARRARERPATGRPLSPATAWAVLLLASGRSEWRSLTEHGHGHEPRRAQTWLATHPLVDNAFRLQRRARRESFDAHPSELRRIAARPDVMRTGISASAEIGVHGGQGEVELYAPEPVRERMIAEHRLDVGAGSVVVRWVPGTVWCRIHADVAPSAAILVDPLEHHDPRVRREARNALAA